MSLGLVRAKCVLSHWIAELAHRIATTPFEAKGASGNAGTFPSSLTDAANLETPRCVWTTDPGS